MKRSEALSFCMQLSTKTFVRRLRRTLPGPVCESDESGASGNISPGIPPEMSFFRVRTLRRKMQTHAVLSESAAKGTEVCRRGNRRRPVRPE